MANKRTQAKHRRRKEKKAEQRAEQESKMAKHLEENGWAQSEHDPNVWKICMFYESNEVVRTLHQAYKIQLKLDADSVNEENLVGSFDK